jgi:hypothetical protein
MTKSAPLRNFRVATAVFDLSQRRDGTGVNAASALRF